MSGIVPDVAVFIDGLNEFISEGNKLGWTDRYNEIMQKEFDEDGMTKALRTISIYKLISRYRNRMSSEEMEKKQWKMWGEF